MWTCKGLHMFWRVGDSPARHEAASTPTQFDSEVTIYQLAPSYISSKTLNDFSRG